MKQVFWDKKLEYGMKIALDEKTAHHLFDVTRTSPDERIRIIDADSSVFYGRVCEKPVVEVLEAARDSQNQQPEITLCCALIKADKFEWMLQKSAELGVTRIVPFVSTNTVIQIDERKIEKKMERWKAILLGACRQCNRTSLVQLEKPCRIGELDRFKSSLNVCAWEKERQSRHLCCELEKLEDSVTYVIGPEGGLSPKEAQDLEQAGFALCSLGPRILRAETAACYLLSCTEFVFAQKQASCSDSEPAKSQVNGAAE